MMLFPSFLYSFILRSWLELCSALFLPDLNLYNDYKYACVKCVCLRLDQAVDSTITFGAALIKIIQYCVLLPPVPDTCHCVTLNDRE